MRRFLAFMLFLCVAMVSSIPAAMADVPIDAIDPLTTTPATDINLTALNARSLIKTLDQPISEAAVASVQADLARGLAADGNSRIILRAQTPQAGNMTFETNLAGARLETLTPGTTIPAAGIPTTFIRDGLYQASAVLVAPEAWPGGVNFPNGNFTVTVKLAGATSGASKTLSVNATPVVLIHGLWGDQGDTFGISSPEGVYHKLHEAGIEATPWMYDGTKGPSQIITGPNNGLARTIASVIDSLNQKEVACTRVDFVVHSMGGLMARQFLRTDFDTGYKSDISYNQGSVRRVVTIATPHRGSPEASYLLGNFSDLGDRWRAHSVISTGAEFALPALRKVLYFLKGDATGAMTDLAFNSQLLNELSFPAVPMHAIYGTVRGDLSEMARCIGETGGKISQAVLLPPFFSVFLQTALPAIGGSLTDWALSSLLDALFNGYDYDLCVSDPSAHGDFPGSSTGKDGMDYSHTTICGQNDIGGIVVDLLKGPVSAFRVSGASAGTAVRPSAVKAVRDVPVVATENYFDERITLTANSRVLFGAGKMKFTGTAGTPFEHDVYMVIRGTEGERILKVSDAGTSSFSVTLEFSSQDIGILSLSCFMQGDGEKIYTSNMESLVIKPKSTDIRSLEFLADTVFTNVSSDVTPALYATMSTGTAYNVSSPRMGTVWTAADPTVAEVTEAGAVRGLKEGATSLTASYGGFTATVSVDVGPAYSTDSGNDDRGETPTSDKGSGGCDAGLGGLGLLCAVPVLARKKRK